MRALPLALSLLVLPAGAAWAGPVPLPNGDFAAGLTGWSWQGPGEGETLVASAAERGPHFSPRLAPGERGTLTTAAALPLQAYHAYRLDYEARGAPFTTLALRVFGREAGGERDLGGWPVWYGALAPAPEWERRSLRFSTPGLATPCFLQVAWEGKGLAGERRPGLDNVALTDLGPLPPQPAPLRNLQPDPGLENAGEGPPPPGWPPEGQVVTDETAHSGRRLLRLERTGRSILTLGGAAVAAPAVVRLSLWVRGQGTAYLRGRAWGPAVRLQDWSSPALQLTADWQELVLEAPVAPQWPPVMGVSLVLDVTSGGVVDVDDGAVLLTHGAAVDHQAY